MKKKRYHVMADPELDLIFTEAYRNTLRRVERSEREKEFHDHIDAMADLFERELASRDLTTAETGEFVKAFRRQIEHAEKDLRERREESRRLRRLGVILFASVLILSGLIYTGVRKPFTPISSIETELDEKFLKVESGYGTYAKEYYRILDKYERRLGPERAGEYERAMHRALEEQFEELVGKVEAGEITYYDDARTWAGYFPEKDEQKARRSRVDNAMAGWIGKAVDESLDKVIEGAKALIEKAKD